MWWEYFSLKFCRVFHQSALELSYFDQNWAKTGHLLFKTFESLISIDSSIVQWPVLVILRKTKLTLTAVIIIHGSGLTYIQPQTACSSPQPPASAPSSSSTSHISRTKNVETQKAKHGLETFDNHRVDFVEASLLLKWQIASEWVTNGSVARAKPSS